MVKIEMKELTAEELTGMREINNQELEVVSGGAVPWEQSWLQQMVNQGIPACRPGDNWLQCSI